jgi:hypothetical protein
MYYFVELAAVAVPDRHESSDKYVMTAIPQYNYNRPPEDNVHAINDNSYR